MYKINDILVALDLSAMDDVLLKYAAKISKHLQPEKIYLTHVAKEKDLPEDLVKAYPGLITPLDEVLGNQIKSNYEKFFDDELKAKVEIIVTEGSPEKVILDLVKDKDIELVLLGRKNDMKGEGVKAHKLAKILPCTIAFVPEILPETFKKILTPTDFSSSSQMALEFATTISEMNPGSTITCFHAYNIPSGYSSTGKSYEEFSDIMKDNAKKRFDVQMKNLSWEDTSSISCKFELTEQGEESETMYDFALVESFDAIVMGSKGRTGMASLLLGSTAEKLIEFNKSLPVFIVKNKKSNMSFIDALLKL
ncbi:MAG: universal stress protein UspA [Thalassobius sp.]|nr:universal stress protein UspA [Thalassovita sp.]